MPAIDYRGGNIVLSVRNQRKREPKFETLREGKSHQEVSYWYLYLY